MKQRNKHRYDPLEIDYCILFSLRDFSCTFAGNENQRERSVFSIGKCKNEKQPISIEYKANPRQNLTRVWFHVHSKISFVVVIDCASQKTLNSAATTTRHQIIERYVLYAINFSTNRRKQALDAQHALYVISQELTATLHTSSIHT